MRPARRPSRMPSWVGSCVLVMLCLVLAGPTTLFGRELLPPKEQKETQYGEVELPSLDEQRRGRPQSIFLWIQMAKGYQVEWHSLGRQGWYTQDPRIKPIEPTHTFTPDTPAIYIVFEVAPLEDPAQFSAQWFHLDENRSPSGEPLGTDVLEVPGHSRWGYLELKSPSGAWPQGDYLVKVYITPLGQQPFHAVNQVGTMHFTVTDRPVASTSNK